MTNRRFHFRAGAAFLSLLGVMSAQAVPPPIEKKAPDLLVPSSGISITAPWGTVWPTVAFDDLVVTLGPIAADGRVLYAWSRDGSGKTPVWSWTGLLAVGGTQPIGTPHEGFWRIAGDHRDTVAFTALQEGLTVVRRINGAWQYRGLIPTGNTSSNVIRSFAIEGDLAITGATDTSTFWKYDAATGTWGQVAQFPAQFAFPAYWNSSFGVGSQFAPGFALLPTMLPVAGWGTTGRTALRMIDMQDPDSPTLLGDILQTEPMPWALGTGICIGDDWVMARSVVRSDGSTSGRIFFYRRSPDGFFTITQVAPTRIESPVYVHNGRLLTTQAIWTLGDDGVWHRGPLLTLAPSWLAYGDAIRVTTDFKLAIWSHVLDCNGDGIDDALTIASGASQDCNRNGRPDECDISDGLLADANGNMIPDLCEADCDGNGVSDLTQIREGAPNACSDPYLLASCAIAQGAADINHDGIVDACGPDLDADGVPDVIEIASGAAADCSGDGIPDEMTPYQLASPNNTMNWYYMGVPIGSSMILSMGYDTDPNHRWLTHVSFGMYMEPSTDVWSPLGQPYQVHIFSDPNGDGVVDDGELLWSGEANVQNSPRQEIDLPSVEISTLAFVVAYAPPQGAFCYAWSEYVEYGSIKRGLFGAQGSFGDSTIFNGHPGLRGVLAIFPAAPLPADHQAALLAGEISSLKIDIRVQTSGCALGGDITRDGIVDGGDLGILLGEWGDGPSVADLNGDGMVDGADLGILIASWSV